MNTLRRAALVFLALFELVRYDIVNSLRGFNYVRRELLTRHLRPKLQLSDIERAVCGAVSLATCLYWKPVLCLQRSVCAMRLLRRYGVDAKLVIGYRPSPIFSHAWVEVDGRVLTSSPAYKTRLRVLCVI